MIIFSNIFYTHICRHTSRNSLLFRFLIFHAILKLTWRYDTWYFGEIKSVLLWCHWWEQIKERKPTRNQLILWWGVCPVVVVHMWTRWPSVWSQWVISKVTAEPFTHHDLKLSGTAVMQLFEYLISVTCRTSAVH